jgi:hypothetical protein
MVFDKTHPKQKAMQGNLDNQKPLCAKHRVQQGVCDVNIKEHVQSDHADGRCWESIPRSSQ